MADVTPATVHLVQQLAAVRLHLYIVSKVHELLADVAAAGASILRAAGEDDVLDIIRATNANAALQRAWRSFTERYVDLVGWGMRQAASLPFGALAVWHDDHLLPLVEEVMESYRRPQRQLVEQAAAPANLFNPALAEVLRQAETRIAGGVTLSGRIWRLDLAGRQGIDRVLMDGIGNGRSAWETAGLLEEYLGAGQDCPRWARSRLFGLTKADIAAGNTTGLFSGGDCGGQGVAYNALRLARNEMQAVLNMATDAMLARSPFVIAGRIHLSAGHPKADVCDDVVSSGEGGQGVYAPGEISLPPHVGCLCFKEGVLMDPALLAGRLSAWRSGGAWPAMGSYQSFVGGSLLVQLGGLAIAAVLITWAFGDATELDSSFEQG